MKLIDGNLARSATPADSDDYSLHLAAAVRDIKNSLGIITALLEVDQQDAPAAPTVAGNAQMQREVQRIDNVVTQLLYNYQLAQGQLQLQPEEVDLRQFAEDLVLRCKYASADRDVSIDCDDEDYPLGYFDRPLVRSVILSALLSAIRYARDTVSLRITQHTVTVALEVSYCGVPYPDELVGGVGLHAQCPPDIEARSPAAMALQFAAHVAWLHQQACGEVTLQVGNTDTGGFFRLQLPAA